MNSEPTTPTATCTCDCYLLGFPQIGERVTVTRKSGKTLTARIDAKSDATFRDTNNLHWLTDDNKLADVKFDPIIEWRSA